MRKLILSLLMVTFGLTATATSNTITSLVEDLAQNNYKVKVHKLQGKTAATLLKNLALKENKIEEQEFKLIDYPEKLPDPETTSGEYGLCKVNQFMGLMIAYWPTEQDIREGAEPPKITTNEAWDSARELQERGMLFGYTSDGSSVCGVTHPSPLVIDEKHSTVYEIMMVGGGC